MLVHSCSIIIVLFAVLHRKMAMACDGSDADESDESDSETSYKLVVVARTDLGMTAGKLASQVGHAVAETFTCGKKEKHQMLKLWQDDGGMIVVLQATSADVLKNLQKAAKRAGVVTRPVYDHGLTEVDSGSFTALAIGPDEVARVDQISGKLDLLRNASEDTAPALQSRLDAAEAEARILRARNAELEQLLKNANQGIASGSYPSAGAIPAPVASPQGEVWFFRDLAPGVPQPVVPEFFEQWCWEGDVTVLPSKWEDAVEECCDGQVANVGRRPWESPNFDEQGIFFITSRSETCGIAVALPAGENASEGVIAALAVKPWCRRRGLGRCLLRLCLQRHADLGRSRVHILRPASTDKCAAAAHLLRAEGFQPSVAAPPGAPEKST